MTYLEEGPEGLLRTEASKQEVPPEPQRLILESVQLSKSLNEWFHDYPPTPHLGSPVVHMLPHLLSIHMYILPNDLKGNKYVRMYSQNHKTVITNSALIPCT